MKKVVCLLAVVSLVLGSVGVVAAEEIERPKNVLSIDVYSLTQGAFEGQYERVLNPSLSYTLGAGVASTLGANAFLGTIGIRKYLKPIAPEGFWFGGSVGVVAVSVLGISVTGYTVAGGLGYKLLTGKFIIEPYIGYEMASIGGFSGGSFAWGLGVGLQL